MEIDNRNFEVKRLTKIDTSIFIELIQLFVDVFENENKVIPKQTYLAGLLERPDFLAYVVIYNNKVIAGLTGYELQKYYSEESEIFIYDIAVSPEFQRQGLGNMLLTSLIKYGNEKGIVEIFVAAHIKDQHALDFYLSTGGHAEQVVHFNYLLKNGK